MPKKKIEPKMPLLLETPPTGTLLAVDGGKVVVDPFSGSGTTLVVAEQLGRKWLGCDNNLEYNSWAIRRLEHVRRMTVADWIAFDRQNATRRESIR